MRTFLVCLVPALLVCLAGGGSVLETDGGELLAPVKLEASGRPIDVERSGHSAPFVGDLDGDGLPDLLVGQFDEGRLRVYRNRGSKGKPRFTTFEWFEAGGEPATVPVG